MTTKFFTNLQFQIPIPLGLEVGLCPLALGFPFPLAVPFSLGFTLPVSLSVGLATQRFPRQPEIQESRQWLRLRRGNRSTYKCVCVFSC